LRAGAVGINLTQANRVFIMEPAYNPALEAQAIGRVHRLGQTRNVEIIRLVMNDSFESRLLEIFKNGGAGSNNSAKNAAVEDDGNSSDLDNNGEGVARAGGLSSSSTSQESGDVKVGSKAELVGNLTRDRPKFGMDEFDNLFNMKSENDGA